MTVVKVSVDKQGRMVIPAEMRERMGIADGGVVTLELVEDELKVVSPMQAIRTLQRIVRENVPPGVSLVDEFLAARRREAAREDAELAGWSAVGDDAA